MEPRFLPNAVPEEAQRLATVNYIGGSLTAKRGVLAQMFTAGNSLTTCESTLQDISVKGHTRTKYIGADVKTVEGYDYQNVRYPSQTKSQAAGGETIQVRIAGEWWTARLSGSHSNLMTFLCGQNTAGNLEGPFSWKSERGTYYGPVGSSSDT